MLCVIAKIDDAAAVKLAEIQKAAFSQEQPYRKVYGHVTIAAYTGDEESQFVRSVKKMLEGTAAFDITYEKIEVLDETSIIAATPAHSADLESIHRIIAERYDEGLDRWTKEGSWYPHTTLFYSPDADLYDICLKMKQAFVPFSAGVCRIEFSKVLESGYEIIDSLNLNK